MARQARGETRGSAATGAGLSVVILAAGKGTRMKSARAKVLHEVAGRPMIEYPVRLARELGAVRTVCVLGHQRDEVGVAITARFGVDAVAIAIQSEQRGTGDAVACALPALRGVTGPVLILSGDVPLLTRGLLERLIAASRGRRVGLLTMFPEVASGYGRIVRDDKGRVQRIVEEKDADDHLRTIPEVNAGIYCIDAKFLAPALARLSTNNAQGELYLTDVVAEAASLGDPAIAVEAAPDEVMGVNDRVDLARADGLMRARVLASAMRGGATIHRPETCTIDDGVVIEEDAEIGPLVRLAGKTRIGAGARVEQGCVLVDAVIGRRAHLKPYTVITDSEVGEEAQVGPFAHLRPQSVLAARVKIGNFVETKKARFGEGAKASHLSYLGDAEIGANANIGCGTITCNYDGYKKSKTIIGAGAFIGSDTQLVAPVTVGEDAVVGAGTTVTRDVPPGALAVSRAPQTEIAGYAERKRRAVARAKAAPGKPSR